MQQVGTDEYLDGGVADHEPITEFILDNSVGHILVHAIDSQTQPARMALKRAFAGGVAVIDDDKTTERSPGALEEKTDSARYDKLVCSRAGQIGCGNAECGAGPALGT